MICPACGYENPDTSKFCSDCGVAVPQAGVCSVCGTQNAPGSKFCNECGRPLAVAFVATIAPASPAPAFFVDGRYEVKRFLGEGGKKRVYLARDTKLDRDVAFALIKTDGLDEGGLLRVKREAQAMGRLGDHPHIVSVYDIGEEGGQPYLVSQLMAGGDLEGLIAKAESHRVSLDLALRIADQVCQALEHAHGQGIVHRDLKPGNVWLTADGTAKLGDFGLAVALDRTRLTQAGMMVGTVSYMPPEQALGGEVTPRSDLYSLGAMLYELVTGRPPFVGDETVAIITQHLNTPPVAPSWHVPDVSPGMEALILRLLEKDASKRPASAAEVRQMLRAARAPTPTPPPTLREGPDDGDGSPLPKLGEGLGVRAVVQPLRDNPLYRRTFVGREAELRQLQGAFDRALSGEGSLIAVVGEPGIGKTALCEQIATYVAVRGGKTLVGHSYEEGSLALPYLPFVEALRSYVLARDPDGLKQDLGSGAAEVARIVSEIRDRLAVSPTPGPQSSAPAPAPDDDRWRLYHALASFLRNASNVQPLLVILEDLHWADRATLDLLVYLSRQLEGARLLIVGNYRDVEVDRAHPLSGTLAELRRGSSFQRVPLRGLTADEVQRMMSAIVGQDVSWSLSEAVHRQTEGNPLFVQEVLRYLAEEGMVTREGGRWQRMGSAALELSIPEGLRDVIGKRLSRLSTACNQVLATAAVIGRDFELRTLQAVSPSTGSGQAPQGEEALIAALEEAVRVGVLDDQSRPGLLRYRFAHAFFRQTLYEELFSARRLRLHQQVARALERQYASRPAEHAAELAEHFAQSTDPEDLRKAVSYAKLAAERALAVNAYGEAARLLQQAVQAQEVLDPDDAETRCDLLLALSEALGPAGEPLRAAEEVAPEALALADGLHDRARAFRACRGALVAYRRHGGTSVFSRPAYQRWAETIGTHATSGTAEEALACFYRATAWEVTGRRAEAWELYLRAVALARPLGDPVLQFEVAEHIALGLSVTPEGEIGRRDVIHEAVALPRDGVSAVSLSIVLSSGAVLRLAGGDRAGAEALYREVGQLADQTRDPFAVLQALYNSALLATVDGDLEGAINRADAVRERASAMGMELYGQLIARLVAFRARLYLGQASAALEHATSAQSGVPTLMSQPILALAHMGREAESQAELAERYGEHARRADDPGVPTSPLISVLEAAVLLRDAEAAARVARRLESLHDQIAPTSNNFTAIARHLGGAAALQGDRAAARAYYEEALEVAGRIRHRPEIALTRLALAELLLDEAVSHQPSAVSPEAEARGQAEKLMADTLKAEGSAHLDFAIEEFRAMKMQPSLERALRHKGLLKA